MTDQSELTALELFAGAGGLALGTQQAGFHHLAVLENEPNAVETLRRNAEAGVGVRTDLPIETTDVRTIEYDFVNGGLDLLAAGAPCQPFSLGGKHQGHEDDRNLFPEVFRAQRELHPKALLLENVRGLARKSFRPYLEYILLQLALPGLLPKETEDWRSHKERLIESLAEEETGSAPAYDIQIASLECADYGVPQKRHRVFMVGFRTDLETDWDWPEKTHSKEALLHAKFTTQEYWESHDITNPPEDEPVGPIPSPNGHARWKTVRDIVGSLPDPIVGERHPIHPNHVGVDGAKKYPGHTGSPLDEPSKTLKAGVHGVPGGENMLRRPDGSVRYYTVFESALLQTFPQDYVFAGSRTAAMRQIGNAVPVAVARQLAELVREQVERAPTSRTVSRRPRVDLVDEQQLTLV